MFKLSHNQQSTSAKKAAATRKRKGIKSGFGKLSKEKRHQMALKRIAHMKAEGKKGGFGHMTPEQRHAAAMKAAASHATRKHGATSFRYVVK